MRGSRPGTRKRCKRTLKSILRSNLAPSLARRVDMLATEPSLALNNQFLLALQNQDPNGILKGLLIQKLAPLIGQQVSFYAKRFNELDREDIEQEIKLLVIQAALEHKPRFTEEFGFISFLKKRIYWRMSEYIDRNLRQVRRRYRTLGFPKNDISFNQIVDGDSRPWFSI